MGSTGNETDLMTIRQMCDDFDVTPRALRFYETRELLFPVRQGQRRLYGRRDKARLQLILQGKRFGFSLEQIRHLLELYDPSTENRIQIRATIETARERLSDMERQRIELGQAITELAGKIAESQAHLDALDAQKLTGKSA